MPLSLYFGRIYTNSFLLHKPIFGSLSEQCPSWFASLNPHSSGVMGHLRKKVETIQDINCFHCSKCWFPHLSFPKRGKKQGTQLPSELNSMGTAQEDCKRPVSRLELEPSHFTEWTRPKGRMISFMWHFQRLVKQGPTQGTFTLTK